MLWTRRLLIPFVTVISGFGTGPMAHGGYYEDAVATFKPAWTDLEPKKTVDQWLAPFDAPDRSVMAAMRLVSEFGAPRQSFVKGHWHTGTDMSPGKKAPDFNYVYAMARGIVVSVHLGDPHRTVVVKHRLPDGQAVWTSYKHLQNNLVDVGQEVDTATRIGRLYTRAEAQAQGGNYDHLHLEIRKDVGDYGVGSWTTMDKAELGRRFHDPWLFLRKNLGPLPRPG